MEKAADAARDGGHGQGWRKLAALAGGAFLAAEVARRLIPQPPEARGWQLLYWFTDHVFFNGPLLVFLVIALTPRRDRARVKWVVPLTGGLLLVGSMLQFSGPFFLIPLGILAGLAIKASPASEQLYIVMTIAGLGIGIPLQGYTGLLAAKTNFNPGLMASLFGATAGVGSVSVAVAFAGISRLTMSALSHSLRQTRP